MNVENLTSSGTATHHHVDGHDQANVARDVIILLLNAITAILGLIGNVIVCKVLFKSKKVKISPTYAHMASMAISDILGALSIPGQWLFCSVAVLESGSGAVFFCALFKSMGVLSWFVSTWSMTAIAVDRYKAVHQPHSKRRHTRLVVALIWVYSLVFIVMTGSSIKISKYFGQPIISCDVIFKKYSPLPMPSHTVRKLRVAGVLLTQYAIPLIITAVLYGFTVRTVWRRSGAGSSETDRKLSKKRKTILMMIIVVVVFAISWLPLHIYHLLNFFGIKAYKAGKCNAQTFYLFFWWLGISSCFYNPFIYFSMDPEFRREWLKIWSYFTLNKVNIVTSPVNEMSSSSSHGVTNTTNSKSIEMIDCISK